MAMVGQMEHHVMLVSGVEQLGAIRLFKEMMEKKMVQMQHGVASIFEGLCTCRRECQIFLLLTQKGFHFVVLLPLAKDLEMGGNGWVAMFLPQTNHGP